MIRGIWWSLLLAPFAAGCAGPHVGGVREAGLAIGICLDAGTDAQVHEQTARQMARQDVELVGCLGEKAEAGQAPKLEWQRPKEFEGVRSGEALPRRPADARFGYSFERGPLHLTVIETADPMAAGSEAYLWLMEDLSLATQPWKVVVLARPIVSPSLVHVDPERIDLAELLAREGVALAIAAGGPAYFRTARIGEARQESVRYVLLGGDGRSVPPAPPPKPAPEWTARTITEPCFCVLDVRKSGLRWKALDLQGRLLDLLEVASGEGSASQAQVFTWDEVLRSGQAQTTTPE
jgi:hypothetical protein